MASSFTHRSVEQAKPDPSKRRELADGALPGFYLVIQPSGSKAWAVRYRAGGVPRKLTLGPFPRLSLAEARDAARKALQAASEGRDPAAEKAAAQAPEQIARNTFGSVAADYIERHAKAHHRTWRETERILTKLDVAAWKSRDIKSIGRRDVLDVLDAHIDRGSPVQANRFLTRVKPFFDWTVERGILDVSPANGIRPPSPETSRERVLTDDELRAVWKAAEEIAYPFGHVVQLLILTGQRRGEVLNAEWAEMDISSRLWTIPKQRSKTNVAHLVPLASPTLELVDRLPRIGTPARLIFTTNGETLFSGVSKVFDRLNKRAAEHLGKSLAPWRPHDLRRTFATGCARLGMPIHVIEKALNHTSGTFGGIVGVYQRHEYAEERRRAMEVWGRR